MSNDTNGSRDEQIRAPKSQRWLQFYVDLFLTNCPKHCKDVRLTVIADPMRDNGCNWRLSVFAPEGKSELAVLCLQHIDSDLRLLFSIFDLDADSAESVVAMRPRRA